MIMKVMINMCIYQATNKEQRAKFNLWRHICVLATNQTNRHIYTYRLWIILWIASELIWFFFFSWFFFGPHSAQRGWFVRNSAIKPIKFTWHLFIYFCKNLNWKMLFLVLFLKKAAFLFILLWFYWFYLKEIHRPNLQSISQVNAKLPELLTH